MGPRPCGSVIIALLQPFIHVSVKVSLWNDLTWQDCFYSWAFSLIVKCPFEIFSRHTLAELSTSTRSCGSSSSSTGSSLTPGMASSGGRSVRSPPRSDNSTITTSELLFLHLFAQMEVNQLGDCTIKRIPFYGKGEKFRRDFQINFLHNYFSLNQGKNYHLNKAIFSLFCLCEVL